MVVTQSRPSPSLQASRNHQSGKSCVLLLLCGPVRFGFDSHEELFARRDLKLVQCPFGCRSPQMSHTHETRASAPYRESLMAAMYEPFVAGNLILCVYK